MNKTNNDIMWDCIVDIFEGKPSFNTAATVDSFVESYHKNNGKEVEFNFSHDNWGLVLCWLHFFGKDKSKFPTFGHHSLHPVRFVKFLWMKYSIFYPLRVITILDMIVRHGIIRRKTDSGVYHTSGLLLDFYHAFSYKQKFKMWILNKLMKTMFNSWDEVFKIYHDHPAQYNYKVYEAFKDLS